MNNKDLQNFRKLALISWINSKGGLNQVCMDNNLNRSTRSHILQILRGAGLGIQAARNLELKLDIPYGWLDTAQADVGANEALSNIPNISGKKAVLASFASGLVSNFDTINIPQYPALGWSHNSVPHDHPAPAHSSELPCVITDIRVSTQWLNKFAANLTHVKNLFILTGTEDDMDLMYNIGDPLLIDTGIKTVNADAVYFFRFNDANFIKRIKPTLRDNFSAIHSNQSKEAWTTIPNTDFQVLGRVLKIWRSGTGTTPT